MNKYFTREYINYPRWESFWVQINETLKTNPKTVLEVGKGSGIVADILKHFGVEVKTIDNDKENRPDIVGDVRRLPFPADSFDTVVCCQVLEHLPLADFTKALRQLRRVTRNYVVLSLPEPFATYFFLSVKLIPFLPRATIFTKINPFRSKLKPNSRHRWEINAPVGLDKLNKIFSDSGLEIVRSFCPPENLFHRFFVLKKR